MILFFPHNLQHQQRPELFLVSVVYHIFGAYFSVALVCSRFCWLQSGMQQKFPISCLMCNCLAICRSFFSLFHIACLGSILLFLVLAQPCPLIYCNRNRPADACSHNLFCLREFVTCQKKFWVLFSQNYMHFGFEYSYVLFTLEDPDS